MPKLKMKRALNEIYEAGLENARFEVTFDGETIFTSNQVFYEFADNYSSYTCYISDLFQATTAAFIALYSRYRDNTKAQLYRAYQALLQEYNPLSNYDMTETGADGKKLSTETNTPHGGTETVTTTNVNGLASTGDGVRSDQVTVQNKPLTGADTQKSYANDKSIDFDGTTHTGYHEGTEHFLKRSGNVGVTSNVQLLNEELEVRKRDLLREWVKEFIDRYCYTTGGVDCDYPYL